MKFRISKKALAAMACVVTGIVAAGGGWFYVQQTTAKPEFSLAAVKCELAYSVVGASSHGPRLQLYVKTDEMPGAQRAHFSVHAASQLIGKLKADSAKIALLAQSGPAKRAAMKAPYLGSEVVYVSDAENHPDLPGLSRTYRGYYVDATASTEGGFYGTRIPLKDASLQAMTKDGDAPVSCIAPTKPLKSA